MTIAAIRKKLMTFIADADDRKVRGLYMLVEDEMNRGREFELSDEYLQLLDEERKKHVSGESKSYSWEEAKSIIRSKKKI